MKEDGSTIRRRMLTLLEEREMGAQDISQMLGIREKEVYEHLPHIARSVSGQKRRLYIRPSECIKCGHVFEDRRRFTRPGRCPRCKDTYLTRPSYWIE